MGNGQVFRSFTKGIDKKVIFKKMDQILTTVPDREAPEWDHLA